ncbi:MAG: thiamine pyrophosphate-requiring protein [Naasia sp.]|nr:thiamine pyrophosphate-requiring protein [Naasia sp.]
MQIDLNPRNVGNRYPIEVGLVGDAGPTLRHLLDRVQGGRGSGWRAEVEESVRRWRGIAAERAATPADPLNPESAIRELGSRLPADAQLALDVGSVVYWYARQLVLPPGVPAHVSGTLASMGCGVPYGIAAKFAEPARPVVVLTGDGGMQMTGVAELITVVSRWRDWADLRFVVAVLNNGDLAEVTWEQREMESAPRFPESQALPDFPYAGYAELLGLTGIRVTAPDEVGAAWDAALTADRPVLIEFDRPRRAAAAALPSGTREARSPAEGAASGGDRNGPAGPQAAGGVRRP